MKLRGSELEQAQMLKRMRVQLFPLLVHRARFFYSQSNGSLDLLSERICFFANCNSIANSIQNISKTLEKGAIVFLVAHHSKQSHRLTFRNSFQRLLDLVHATVAIVCSRAQANQREHQLSS